jgi:hypothetical protein
MKFNFDQAQNAKYIEGQTLLLSLSKYVWNIIKMFKRARNTHTKQHTIYLVYSQI